MLLQPAIAAVLVCLSHVLLYHSTPWSPVMPEQPLPQVSKPLQNCLQGADPPFLYGTHYSCPGYVMYWLVRAAPAHLLRLQNGRFDAPDRMFCSIRESWDSVTRNPADVKELIPEFFLSSGRWAAASNKARNAAHKQLLSLWLLHVCSSGRHSTAQEQAPAD